MNSQALYDFLIWESVCLPSRLLASAAGARLISFVVWKMREAHFPHHTT